MGKPWNKKQKPKAHHGPCFVKDCPMNGAAMHHCEICEKLAAEGKLKGKEPFTVQFCGGHSDVADAAIKRHVLLKHPGTLPGFLLACLKGDA